MALLLNLTLWEKLGRSASCFSCWNWLPGGYVSATTRLSIWELVTVKIVVVVAWGYYFGFASARDYIIAIDGQGEWFFHEIIWGQTGRYGGNYQLGCLRVGERGWNDEAGIYQWFGGWEALSGHFVNVERLRMVLLLSLALWNMGHWG